MFTYQDDYLYLEEKSVNSLANELGTPFFLISEARLRANYGALVRGISHSNTKATVRYCAKTNNESGVLEILADCGSHVLVSHSEEARLALRCGFTPEKIAYQRPVVLEKEVRSVLEAGIAFFHAYRLQDLDIIEKVAAELGMRVRISLRLRNDSPGLGLSFLNFLSRRHGFRQSCIPLATKRIRDSEWLNLVAINFYLGTQQESVLNYRKLLRRVIMLVSKLQSQMGVSLEEINLGGGISSQSLRKNSFRSLRLRLKDSLTCSDSPEALEEFVRLLSAQFREEVQRSGLRPLPAIAVEPGRAIVGNAVALVTRVCAVQGNWVFLDASHNHLKESPLLFTRRIFPVSRVDSGTERYYHLSGSSLNTLDIIDFRRRLPALEVGDVLAICDVGAYSISRASRYAGLPPAVYLLQSDGSLRMIRRAENFSDLICPMVMR